MAIQETTTVVTMPSRWRQDRKQSTTAPAANTVTAFDAVYRTQLSRVYAYVAYRVGNRELAEDITAQVFEKAWRSWSGFDPQRAQASTWLIAIARNAVTDHLRGSARHPQIKLDEQTLAAADDPVLKVEAGELRRKLALAIAVLDDREKEILSLKFGARMTNRQIADSMGVTQSNAGTILFRSLTKLKTRLEGGIQND
ncbi:MAG: RNA polymerase sigma factor [Thermoleophilia bacterium]